MSAVASILAIALFLAFVTSGLQKVLFNPAMSKNADELGFPKRSYQRIGGLEILGGLGLLVGLASKGSSIFAVTNEVAGACLVLLMVVAIATYARRGVGMRRASPAAALGLLVLVEVLFRLSL